ncbi:MAG TPA: dolichyl-phosphate beta-D-mannosyltransferase [Phycisphaerales bacterium]|nr:dolichyl-phosphate beta-D-mannosyltransferase [Phycisphaerales bacterium]HCD33479.1 dolichyl-phosphate beta-D-mannosyltransferase [Phycisphaerales bacterium]|tara:strand:- start:23667 stop:26330 length:2664 start_codon:yes stop_codon:yes gene_type:complete
MQSPQLAPELSIVVPTLNEAGNIDNLLTHIFDATRSHISLEVIVVDDGSTDSTRDIVMAWSQITPVRLLARENKRDLATAVTDGAALASSDVILVMDADMSHPAEKIVELAQPVINGTHDVAIGSRYVRGGKTVGWPWYRQILSRGATVLAWPFADARDPMSGFFCVRRERLVELGKHAAGYKIGLEVLAGSKTDLRVIEVPITFAQRVEGESKLKASTIYQYLERLLALSGGSIGATILGRYAGITVITMLIDLLVYVALRHQQFQLGSSHIISFFISVIIAYNMHVWWTIPNNASPTKKTVTGRFVSFLILSLLALFLRGGLLGNLTEHGHWPELLAMIPTMLVSNMVLLGILCYLLFPQTLLQQNPWLRWRVAVIGGVGYVLAMKLVYMGVIDLIPEEAYYWNYAKHLSFGYLDHPPMVAWLIALGTAILGDTELGVRIGSVLCWLMTLGFVYRLASDMYDKSTAMRSILMVTVLPFFFMTGFLMTPDAPLTTCWAGTLYYLQRALLREQHRAWYGAGIFLGLGMLSKYTIVLLGPAALIMMLTNRQHFKHLLRFEPYAASGIALLIFSPVLIWNAQHQWASFVFQGPRRLAPDTVFSEHILLGGIALLLTPIGLLAAITAWSKHSKTLHVTSNNHKFDRMFAAVFTITPLAVFIYFSLQHEPKLNWTGPIWLALIPLMSHCIQHETLSITLREKFSTKLQQLWQPTLLCTLLIMGGLMHYLVLGLPGVGYSDKMRLPVAWEEMGLLVENVEEQVEADTQTEPLVVGLDKYFTASQVAFYRHKMKRTEPNHETDEGFEHTTADHLFDGTGLMYKYWFPAKDQTGRILLLISRDPSKLSNQSISVYFDSLSPIQQARISKHDKSAGGFYYRVGYNYHGPQVAALD